MINPVKWTAALASPISNPNSTTSPGTLNWMPGQSLPSSASSSAAPSLVTSGGKLWCVHNDSGGGNGFWYTTYDFNQWQSETRIPGNFSFQTLSLYDNGGYVCCVYSGQSDDFLWFTKDNGNGWDPAFTLPHLPATDAGLSATVPLNGTYYVAVKGLGSTELWVVYWQSLPGDVTMYQVTVPGYTIATPSGPALCLFQGKLWCVFRGTDNGFYTITSDDGLSWSAPVGAGSAAMDSQPTLCVVPGQQGNPDTLLCVFGDSRGYNSFWYLYNTSGDPGDWVGGAFIPPLDVSRVNGSGMGLAVWNDVVFGAYMST